MNPRAVDSAAGDSAPEGRRIVFWRHGRTEWNARGLFQGQEDIALDDLGRQQAAQAAHELKHLAPSLIVSSDLERARDTAAALSVATGVSVGTDARFRETYAGKWQGLAFADIGERFPEDQQAWHEGDPHVAAGGGESRSDVGGRMKAGTLDAVDQLAPGQTLVVVSHGGAIRAGVAALMGIPADLWGSLAGVANCHWSVLEELNPSSSAVPLRWQLTEHNVGLASMPSSPLEG
ncbi:histidine phosphatase family protein [Arthrobacter tumbae]|uniref:histidine phosphatase family protein n=1 Tax=Arthrobacter tumbae TaxID=163874 RepID=UPI00195AF8F9|nr:histidine phosphatase family protein [Arthrobacter tumbae]MBM7782936.1 putative phosphoglycerate mutase [Arthrobacter tumbae]